MRRRIIVVVLALAAVIVTAIAALAGPQGGKRPLRPERHAPSGSPTRDNFGWTTFTHPAGSSHGYVDVRSWIYQTYSISTINGHRRPEGWSGVGEIESSPQVRFIGFRVVLHTDIGDTFSSDVFKTTAHRAKTFTRTLNYLEDLGFAPCEGWTEVRAYITFSDGQTFGGYSWSVPGDLWNDNCYFL